MKTVMRTSRGLVRKNNEDTVFVSDVRGIFVVADGMGGGEEGERASQMTCAAIERMVTANDFADRLTEAGAAIEAANCEIFEYARAKHIRQMGTTVALLAIDTETFGRGAIAYVGDSRVYRLRGTKAELLTRDHSIGAELEAQVGGRYGAAFSDRTNPLAHVLTRSVGPDQKVEPEWRKIDVEKSDIFLVCSDGVHDLISTEELPGFFVGNSLEKAAKALEDEIIMRGAHDNYSFILVEIAV